MQITMEPVKSSQIESIGYDQATKTLAVKFIRGGGAVYNYFDVPPSIYAGLQTAESVGTFFGKHVRGAFEFEKQNQDTIG